MEIETKKSGKKLGINETIRQETHYLPVYQNKGFPGYWCSGTLERTKQDAIRFLTEYCNNPMNPKIVEIELPVVEFDTIGGE